MTVTVTVTEPAVPVLVPAAVLSNVWVTSTVSTVVTDVIMVSMFLSVTESGVGVRGNFQFSSRELLPVVIETNTPLWLLCV